MQTFLPYASFTDSVKVLDYRRLGKQRVEAMQILNTLTYKSTAWANHPAVRMWRGCAESLKLYMNTCIQEWISRGYNNTMKIVPVGEVILPAWFGLEKFHSSHRSNLLRKDPTYYGKFGWIESNDLEYYWPV